MRLGGVGIRGGRIPSPGRCGPGQDAGCELFEVPVPALLQPVMCAAQGSEVTAARTASLAVRNRVIQIAAPGWLTAAREPAGLIPSNDEVVQPVGGAVRRARLLVGAGTRRRRAFVSCDFTACGVVGSLPSQSENLTEGAQGVQVDYRWWADAIQNPGRDGESEPADQRVRRGRSPPPVAAHARDGDRLPGWSDDYHPPFAGGIRSRRPGQHQGSRRGDRAKPAQVPGLARQARESPPRHRDGQQPCAGFLLGRSPDSGGPPGVG